MARLIFEFAIRIVNITIRESDWETKEPIKLIKWQWATNNELISTNWARRGRARNSKQLVNIPIRPSCRSNPSSGAKAAIHAVSVRRHLKAVTYSRGHSIGDVLSQLATVVVAKRLEESRGIPHFWGKATLLAIN